MEGVDPRYLQTVQREADCESGQTVAVDDIRLPCLYKAPNCWYESGVGCLGVDWYCPVKKPPERESGPTVDQLNAVRQYGVPRAFTRHNDCDVMTCSG